MTVATREVHKLALPAFACRRVAKFCCDITGVDTATETWLRRVATTFLDASEGQHSRATCEVEASRDGLLRLQARMWKTGATDKILNAVCREISIQLSQGGE